VVKLLRHRREPTVTQSGCVLLNIHHLLLQVLLMLLLKLDHGTQDLLSNALRRYQGRKRFLVLRRRSRHSFKRR
jgi:hypothetical protein